MATMTINRNPVFSAITASAHHALIAGASGSGKSTFLENIIYDILTHNPAECQMVLIDPKRVELSRFKHTAHCAGYATEPEDIEALLNKCLALVDYRYREMEQAGARKYTGTKLYIIVDELADIAFTSKRAFELLERLARIARAAGVQLICATQNINAEVIPTRLKCNLDTRVSVPVSSVSESRVILGIAGAETLSIGEAIIKTGCKVERVTFPEVDTEPLIAFWKR